MVAVGTIITLNMIDLPWCKINPEPKLNVLGEHLRAGKELLGVPQGLDSFAMLPVGYDFEQALFRTRLETSWTEASAVQVDWLLNGCEQAISKIQCEVFQATNAQQLGQFSHRT